MQRVFFGQVSSSPWASTQSFSATTSVSVAFLNRGQWVDDSHPIAHIIRRHRAGLRARNHTLLTRSAAYQDWSLEQSLDFLKAQGVKVKDAATSSDVQKLVAQHADAAASVSAPTTRDSGQGTIRC